MTAFSTLTLPPVNAPRQVKPNASRTPPPPRTHRPSRRHRITPSPTIAASASASPPTATTIPANNPHTRLRASSPMSKSRYISRLKETLQTHCAHAPDEFWAAMQREARAAAETEPLLASFLFASVLNHATLYSSLAFHLANKLSSPAMPPTMLMRLFESVMQDAPTFCTTVRSDLLAVMERDPACTRFIDAMLYFKGFHALQAHRIAHILWQQGRIPLAYHLQSQVSKELQVDVHPAATLGKGIFIDHATGIVVGETAVIGDDCSLLHHVTLGGSGKKHGDRHPKLGNGVLVGAGATLLGNVQVGDGAQIGACSLVLEDIPAGATVVGVPAKILNVSGVAVPALEMKHERCLPGCTDGSHGHSIPPSSEKDATAAVPASPTTSSSS